MLVDVIRAAAHHEGDDRLESYRQLSLPLELTEAAAINRGDSELAVTAGQK